MTLRKTAYFLLFILLLAGCTDNTQETKELKEKTTNIQNLQNETSNNIQLKEAEPYLKKIALNDRDLRKKSFEIVSVCQSDDKECQVNAVYQYIVENYKYRNDPRRDELIQTPKETIALGSGDCEDLTILQNSLLENIGIKTYLVLTDTHAYALACGLNIDKLIYYKNESAKTKYSQILSRDEKFVLKSGAIDYFSVKDADYDPDIYVDIHYNVSANLPVNIYVIMYAPTDTTFSLIRSHQYVGTKGWAMCVSENILKQEGICNDMPQTANLVLYNPNPNSVTIDYNSQIILYNVVKATKGDKVKYYSIADQNCVVLDPTAGEYGYAGYSGNITGKKTAFDPITKKIVDLED